MWLTGLWVETPVPCLFIHCIPLWSVHQTEVNKTDIYHQLITITMGGPLKGLAKAGKSTCRYGNTVRKGIIRFLEHMLYSSHWLYRCPPPHPRHTAELHYPDLLAPRLSHVTRTHQWSKSECEVLVKRLRLLPRLCLLYTVSLYTHGAASMPEGLLAK